MKKKYMFLLSTILLTLCFSKTVNAKTYTAKGWATNYVEQSIGWCRNCGYDVCDIHGDVDEYYCPYCESELYYDFTQYVIFDNAKYSHVDYTVTVKKNKKCWVKFPTSKSQRRAKIGRLGGTNWYDWAAKVKNIKHCPLCWKRYGV